MKIWNSLDIQIPLVSEFKTVYTAVHNTEVDTMATTNTSTNSSDLYETARTVSLVYLIMVGTLGIIGNTIVILVFLKYPKLRTATNVFILNLALCDLIISILDSSFSIVSSRNNQWMFGKSGCLCYGFLHYFFISATVSTLAVIAVDRFFYITKPVQVKAWRITRTRAIVMLIIIYIYVLLFTFPPLAGWSSFIVEEHFFSGCYIHYGDQQPPSIGYSVIASFFLFLVPLIVMVFCYSRIFTAVRLSTQKTISKSLKPSTPGSVRKKYPLLKRTHVQTAKMIVVVIFFCVMVWMPYVIVSLIKAFTGNAMPLASHITVLIAKSCVIYNILIYVVLNRKLKASVINFICCGKTTEFFNTSVSKPSVSKAMTSEVRNRLSAIAAVGEANESGVSSDKPSPVLGKHKASQEPGGELGYRQAPANRKNEKRKTVDFSNEDLSRVERDGDDKMKEAKVTERNGENVSNVRTKGQEKSHEMESLSFATLGESNKHNIYGKNRTAIKPTAGENDVTKCEARRRAMRKMNGTYGKERKMLPQIPIKNEKREFQNYQNNNTDSNTNASQSSSKALIVHSRENSSSTAVPSSANSTLSDRSLTSAKDESSVENSPTQHEVQKHKPSSRKSKTLGYKGGKNALLMRERLKKASADPLRASPSELNEIQNYWKRMSLCLDDINIDEELA